MGKRHFYCCVASIMSIAHVAWWVIGIYYRYVIQKQKVQPQLRWWRKAKTDEWRCVVPAALWLQSWWRSPSIPPTSSHLEQQHGESFPGNEVLRQWRFLTLTLLTWITDWLHHCWESLWMRGRTRETKDCYPCGKNNGGDAKMLLPRKIKWHMSYTTMCTTSDGFRNLFSSRFPNKLTQQKLLHIKQSPKDYQFFFLSKSKTFRDCITSLSTYIISWIFVK